MLFTPSIRHHPATPPRVLVSDPVFLFLPSRRSSSLHCWSAHHKQKEFIPFKHCTNLFSYLCQLVLSMFRFGSFRRFLASAGAHCEFAYTNRVQHTHAKPEKRYAHLHIHIQRMIERVEGGLVWCLACFCSFHLSVCPVPRVPQWSCHSVC